MSGPTFAVGEVVNPNDPEQLGRVTLLIPSLLGEAISAWTPVVVAYGLDGTAQCKSGDQVLVLLNGGSPDEMVVLGKVPSFRG